MDKQKFIKALDYFIQYEWSNRLQNITLKKNSDNFINISKNQFDDSWQMKDKLWQRKLEMLGGIVKQIKVKVPYRNQDLLEKIEAALSEKRDETDFAVIEEILTEDCYQYPRGRKLDLLNMKQILEDHSVMLLYPILANGKQKIPLICFTLELEDQPQVQSYLLQKEALRTIVAEIAGCDIVAVEILVKDFDAFYSSLLDLECDDVFSVIKVIEDQLAGRFRDSGFDGLWKYKDYQNWAVTEEIIITQETFGDTMFPIFKEEIEEVRFQCEKKSSPLLQQYLFEGNERIPVAQQPLRFYYGSYAGEYSVNFKQSKVVSAYRDSQLLAVNGPPGTGKTTVLKEIIADNLVRKTEQLVEMWNEPWVSLGSGKQQVYCSPLKGRCDYSMVITSFNNKAVDNIGLDLLKELDYFSELVADEEEDYKGIACARLGNFENMGKFRHQFLQPLIRSLGNSSSDQNETLQLEAETLQENWKNAIKELSNYEKMIDGYVKRREKVCIELGSAGVIAGSITEDKVEAARGRIEREAEVLLQEINKLDVEVEDLKNASAKKGKEIILTNEKIQAAREEKEKLQRYIGEIQKKQAYFLIGSFLAASARKKYGTEDNLKDRAEDIAKNIKFMTELNSNDEEEYREMTGRIGTLKQALKQKKLLLQDSQKLLKTLASFSAFMQEYLDLAAQLHVTLPWNSSVYEYYHQPAITEKRHQLFKLSFKLTELYIKKHRDEIRFNLEKIYPKQWFQPFYRPDFRYDETYETYLKAVWETLFLCFPVVTTTLSSLDKKKFPMINGIFDTIMFDEAGQALLHTAAGPLYRFRKAIIVGDVFQLEPIRGQKERLIEQYDFSQEEKAKLDIEENSIQHAADRGSRVFDLLSQKEVGIVLTEHRRCERDIVEFSNRMVYNNCLTTVKENREKPFLNKNLCMIDIRGIKNKRNENHNEVAICKRVIKQLTEIYGEEYKEKIGIITPYRHQAELLRKEIPEIASGTVHAFQGQEKEIILLSLAIDNSQRNSGGNFVGDKSNFLNVAFTRAKEQLILIGNYEACQNAGNYLTDAVGIIKSKGRVYSLYDTELLEQIEVEEPSVQQFLTIMTDQSADSAYSDFLNKYLSNGLLIDPGKHYQFLREVLKTASSSIRIVSPWIMPSVVNQEFLDDIIRFIERDGKLEICFGYHKTTYSLDDVDKIVKRDYYGSNTEKTKVAIEELHAVLKQDLTYAPPIHTKALVVDDKFMLIGSHNWLSNKGAYKNSKAELSCLVCDPQAIEFVKKRYYS